MSAPATEEKPFHLQGNFAPVKDEVTATDLPVEGALPPELTGLYVRQTANPVSGVSEHWFLGEGMVHGVRLEAGRAAWYRNRYVRTAYLENPDKTKEAYLNYNENEDRPPGRGDPAVAERRERGTPDPIPPARPPHRYAHPRFRSPPGGI